MTLKMFLMIGDTSSDYDSVM
jgi:hypothetical protein